MTDIWKKGKWIDETFKPWGLVYHPYKCNQCGEHSEMDSKFCPMCGAKITRKDRMISLTTKEKADRFDALQAAIRQTKANYEECMRDSDRRRNSNTTIGAYEFGAYETYKRVVSDLERWIV